MLYPPLVIHHLGTVSPLTYVESRGPRDGGTGGVGQAISHAAAGWMEVKRESAGQQLLCCLKTVFKHTITIYICITGNSAYTVLTIKDHSELKVQCV